MKNATLKAMATYSRWTTFHICMLATLLTGSFMAVSAEDLGALGPMIVSLGICAMFFATAAELLFLVRVLARWASAKISNRSNCLASSDGDS